MKHFVLLALFFSFSALASNKAEITQTSESAPGEWIVKLKSDRGIRLQAFRQNLAQGILTSLDEKQIMSIKPIQLDPSLHVVRVNPKMKRVEEALSQIEGVEYAEPNWIYKAAVVAQEALPMIPRSLGAGDDGTPNDPGLDLTWGLLNLGQKDSSGVEGREGSDIHVQPLWYQGFRGSRKTVVAVIDTGIDWDHPDLKDNLFTNRRESGDAATDKIDNDRNGFVDDVHGWNFVDNSPNSRDDQNHGTHCAGTIGAIGNNRIGVAGVNWEVSLLPLKFLDSKGRGKTSDAVNAINYARRMKAKIMSNSWGGGGFSRSLHEAIAAADRQGILFVAAAGNESNDNDRFESYPASTDVPNVIAVAATDNRDHLAPFSNWGAKGVHVAAPGVRIVSTIRDGKYGIMSGTSMATPHVAGAAALLWTANPEWSVATLKERLISTSQQGVNLRRRVLSKGRIHLANAQENIPGSHEGPNERDWLETGMKLESKHPYADKESRTYSLNFEGARYVRLHFSRVEMEAGYDRLTIIDRDGEELDVMTGDMKDYWTDALPVDQLQVKLKSDDTNPAWGFAIDRMQYIPRDLE